jgi:hypothetical protein
MGVVHMSFEEVDEKGGAFERHIELIRSSTSKTETQELLIELLDTPNRSEEDEKDLAVLLRAERSNLRARLASVRAKTILKEKREKQKAERFRLLVNRGRLFEIAGMLEWEPTALLGMLLSHQNASDYEKNSWMYNGQTELENRKISIEDPETKEQKSSRIPKQKETKEQSIEPILENAEGNFFAQDLSNQSIQNHQ